MAGRGSSPKISPVYADGIGIRVTESPMALEPSHSFTECFSEPSWRGASELYPQNFFTMLKQILVLYIYIYDIYIGFMFKFWIKSIVQRGFIKF